MPKSNAFPGRLIFDHFPKTAGQAISAWLRATFGRACVTPDLTGSHRDLIKQFGGEYSIVCAHVSFFGEGFDPRYQYATVIRDPVDRAMSWLFSALESVAEFPLGDGHAGSPLEPNMTQAAVERFIASEGRLFGEDETLRPLMHHISNYYVEHFAAIGAGAKATADEKLKKALAAIGCYDIWGFYETLPRFLSDFSALLEVPPPTTLGPVYVDRVRPQVTSILPLLRKRLEELNALDIEFCHTLRDEYETASKRWQRSAVAVARWAPLAGTRDRVFSAPDFALLSAELEGAGTYLAGSTVLFALRFSLAVKVQELEIGIHIFDQDRRWVFGTNTTMLQERLCDVGPGSYRMRYALAAELPAGDYTAGFAFASREANGSARELAWFDVLLSFQITVRRITPSVGYLSLPVALDCAPIGNEVVALVSDAAGTLLSAAELGDLMPGEVISLPAYLANMSMRDWVSQHVHRINLSYRWCDEAGSDALCEGVRTSLPGGRLPSGARVPVSISLVAPTSPGPYRFQAMPVQEGSGWFDALGFAPLEKVVNVVAPNAVRRYPASDPRMCSQVGRIDDRALISTGVEGFLAFGPYVHVPAGHWQAVLSGSFKPNGCPLRSDVVADCGTKTIAQLEIAETADFITLPFEIPVAVDDLEVRLWVAAPTFASLVELRLIPIAAPFAPKAPPLSATIPAGQAFGPNALTTPTAKLPSTTKGNRKSSGRS